MKHWTRHTQRQAPAAVDRPADACLLTQPSGYEGLSNGDRLKVTSAESMVQLDLRWLEGLDRGHAAQRLVDELRAGRSFRVSAMRRGIRPGTL